MYQSEDVSQYDTTAQDVHQQYESYYPFTSSPSSGASPHPTTLLQPCAKMESPYKENSYNHSDGASAYILPNGLTYDPSNPNNPFLPFCRIPIPSQYGDYGYGVEPAFIRKRNERERERVRNVNDGYDKLRQHLPIANKEKRVSKVETLRAAIKYIQHLKGVLDNLDGKCDRDEKAKCKTTKQESQSIKNTSHCRKRKMISSNVESLDCKAAKVGHKDEDCGNTWD